MKATIYKSLKIKDNTLTFDNQPIYSFGSDILTQAKLEHDISNIKRDIKNSKHIRKVISDMLSFEINQISNIYYQIIVLYACDSYTEQNQRCFKQTINIDCFNGLLISW